MARGEHQNRKMRDERREQILRAGLRLFATKGLAATRATDIAKACGIAQGLLYHYYRSKEELFTELIRSAFERMNDAVCMLEAMKLSPADKIRTAMRELVRGFQQSEDAADYFMLVARATANDAIPAQARKIIEQENTLAYEVLTRIIKAGQRDGAIVEHPPEQLALLFWVIVKGIALHRAAHGEAFAPPDSELLTTVFFVE